MVDMKILEERLNRAERRARWSISLSVFLGIVFFFTAMSPQDDILRARGIVITDGTGRDRLILGAPMAAASDDDRLAETVGIVVMDSLGKLNVALGTNNPLIMAGGATGTRIATATGLTIYDPRNGQERGGMGAFADGRANVCLDYGSASKEAACMSVAPGDQYAAFILNGTPTEEVFDRVTMFVGADGRGSTKVFGGRANRGGVMIRAGKGPASITVYDSTGTAVGDVARAVEN